MLLIFSGISIIAALLALTPFQEVVKILVTLFAIPLVIFGAVRYSRVPSHWSFDGTNLTIEKLDREVTIPKSNISHIRNLRRSGGNLLIIYQRRGHSYRFWRNKLFQNEDQLQSLVEAIQAQNIEYYNM
ncbi:hypothetical protein [Sphingobacterium sp. SYP-B4668]|uniref:hypothetical protein n=1 Tax=Sphingobacterium sp. SYP-B4668 TaxID=2996035 RepID=UPI0022DCEBF1|nr:hypothetical protein [Sphingobacterium sp. SYP-B4668]